MNRKYYWLLNKQRKFQIVCPCLNGGVEFIVIDIK